MNENETGLDQVAFEHVLRLLGLGDFQICGNLAEILGQLGVGNDFVKLRVVCFEEVALTGQDECELLFDETANTHLSVGIEENS